jgi:hypothetical protein
MKIAVLTLALTGLLRADFEYESRVGITGDGVHSATHYIKGSRMASVTKTHATIVNLENDNVLEIDFSKKTYFSTTVSKIKPAVAEVAFDLSEKSDGSKNIGILTAREHLAAATGPPSLARLFIDYWTITPPGAVEMQDFHRRMAAKLGYAYAFGLEEAGRIKPELFPAFEEAGKVLAESAEMPAEVTIRVGTADLAPLAPSQEKTGIAGRIGGIAHRGKHVLNEDEPGLLAEVTIHLDHFSAAPADDAKFGVPPGFKEIKK